MIISNKIVNAEAREEVINNHQANFTGCNDSLDNPTCGQMLINGKPIPFSQVRIKISKKKTKNEIIILNHRIKHIFTFLK